MVTPVNVIDCLITPSLSVKSTVPVAVESKLKIKLPHESTSWMVFTAIDGPFTNVVQSHSPLAEIRAMLKNGRVEPIKPDKDALLPVPCTLFKLMNVGLMWNRKTI